MKGQNASKNYTGKTDSILSCFYTQNLPPKTYSAIPATSASFAVLLAPPSDPFGIYEVWGSTAFHLCPSPGSLRDLQGMGHIEVDESRLTF